MVVDLPIQTDGNRGEATIITNNNSNNYNSNNNINDNNNINNKSSIEETSFDFSLPSSPASLYYIYLNVTITDQFKKKT